MALGRRGLVHLDHLQTPHICATAWANPVGQGFLATLLAVDQMGYTDGVVGAAAVPTAFA